MDRRRKETVYYSSFHSFFLGEVFIASTIKGVCSIDFFTSEKNFIKNLKKRFQGQIIEDDSKNKEVAYQLKEFLSGRRRFFDCKLDLKGTSFEKKVWSFLKKIPFGETRSYKEVAEAIGHPKAFRAVGTANARNPIPLIIPCHRIIKSNGDLGGYGHGTGVKKRLLDFEKTHGF